jgi:nucleotide-binding universal stress UspA family protein
MATFFRKILCPVDFSDNSIAVLHRAAELARRHDGILYVLHVEFVPMNSPDQLAQYGAVAGEPGERRLLRIAQDHLSGVRYQLLVRSGWPGASIESVAQEIEVDLIVIATEGWPGLTHPLGGVAEHVIRVSKCPVLSFGARTSLAAMQRILCPIDFDPNSIAALSFARLLAEEYGAAIELLHVVPTAAQPAQASEQPRPAQESEAQSHLERIAAGHLDANLKCELSVRSGDPSRTILDAADELRSDIIVMATHGRTLLGYLLLGSVALRVIRDSRVPVLTVRRSD